MKDSTAKEILRAIIRTLVVWGFALVGLLLMAWLLPGVSVDTLGTAIVAVAAIALLNGLLWPLLSYVIMPFVILTLGLVSLLMNALPPETPSFWPGWRKHSPAATVCWRTMGKPAVIDPGACVTRVSLKEPDGCHRR